MAGLATLAFVGGLLLIFGGLSWGLAVTLEEQLPLPAWATIALAGLAPQLVTVALGCILIHPTPSPDGEAYATLGVVMLAMISLPICLLASAATVLWKRRRRKPKVPA